MAIRLLRRIIGCWRDNNEKSAATITIDECETSIKLNTSSAMYNTILSPVQARELAASLYFLSRHLEKRIGKINDPAAK